MTSHSLRILFISALSLKRPDCVNATLMALLRAPFSQLDSGSPAEVRGGGSGNTSARNNPKFPSFSYSHECAFEKALQMLPAVLVRTGLRPC